MMQRQEEADDYVIAIGETHSDKEFLEIAFECVGINWQDYVEFEERYLRPAEIDLGSSGLTMRESMLQGLKILHINAYKV